MNNSTLFLFFVEKFPTSGKEQMTIMTQMTTIFPSHLIIQIDDENMRKGRKHQRERNLASTKCTLSYCFDILHRSSLNRWMEKRKYSL